MADTTERPVEQLSDQQLFEFARQLEPAPPVEVTPPEPTPAPVETVTSPAPPPAAGDDAAIPSWRLREEAEGRRAAEDRARALEARLNEIAGHMQQQKKPEKDFFDDPGEATQALILNLLRPYAENQQKTMMAMGKMVADVAHGANKVSEAEQAFLRARDDQSLDPVDYERVVQSPNRYDAVVQWHKRQSVLSSVGDDPNAWFERQLEARMSDPKFQSVVLSKIRDGAAARGATVTDLPPSLSKSTAVEGVTPGRVGDLSDPSLFSYATGKFNR